MRTVIVDDEMAARGLLRKRLRDFPEVEIIGEAENELKAIEIINKLKPDLVFLDIQMTVLSGFEILLYLEERPLVVFCTAHEQHAVRAFEENALDYLLKPVEKERLAKCLAKVKDRLGAQEPHVESDLCKEGLDKVVREMGSKRQVVWLKDVLLFGKEGRYTSCLTRDGIGGLTSLTIDYLADHVKDPAFFRINRSTIVHRDGIKNYSTSYGLTEITTVLGDKLSVSRRRSREFKEWLCT